MSVSSRYPSEQDTLGMWLSATNLLHKGCFRNMSTLAHTHVFCGPKTLKIYHWSESSNSSRFTSQTLHLPSWQSSLTSHNSSVPGRRYRTTSSLPDLPPLTLLSDSSEPKSPSPLLASHFCSCSQRPHPRQALILRLWQLPTTESVAADHRHNNPLSLWLPHLTSFPKSPASGVTSTCPACCPQISRFPSKRAKDRSTLPPPQNLNPNLLETLLETKKMMQGRRWMRIRQVHGVRWWVKKMRLKHTEH